MKKYFSTVLIIGISLLLPRTAFTSCMVKPPVDDEAKNSSVIFVGTVTQIRSAQRAAASYSQLAKHDIWKRRNDKVDVVTFSVSDAFKGVSTQTIDITTDSDGFAGYKFEGGTWLKEGQTYLVYAYTRLSAGSVPEYPADKYDKDVAAALRVINSRFPKKLAQEINEFNSKISPYESNVCMRTTNVSNAATEIQQIRKMFPDAKHYSSFPVLSDRTNTLVFAAYGSIYALAQLTPVF